MEVINLEIVYGILNLIRLISRIKLGGMNGVEGVTGVILREIVRV